MEKRLKSSNHFLYGIKPEVLDYFSKTSTEISHLLGQNAGNILFTKAIFDHVGACPVVDWDEEINGTPLQTKTCVIPSANFLGAHADMGFMVPKIKDFQGLILSIGLGSQTSNPGQPTSIPDGTKEWLKAIVSKCKPNTPNIALRGQSTMRDLEAIGMADNAVITGCPSNFLSSNPRLGETIREKLPYIFERVCVASSHYKWQYLKQSEAFLSELATETGGVYVMQSPSEMISLGLNRPQDIDKSSLEEIRSFCHPNSGSDDFKDLVRRVFRVYLNVSDWLLDMSRHSLVIGARIHGVMAGIQAGIPGLCIAHDQRTIELCQEMKIPYLTREQASSGLNNEKIAMALDVDWSAYDSQRGVLLERYYDFLVSNDISPSKSLHHLKRTLSGDAVSPTEPF